MVSASRRVPPAPRRPGPDALSAGAALFRTAVNSRLRTRAASDSRGHTGSYGCGLDARQGPPRRPIPGSARKTLAGVRLRRVHGMRSRRPAPRFRPSSRHARTVTVSNRQGRSTGRSSGVPSCRCTGDGQDSAKVRSAFTRSESAGKRSQCPDLGHPVVRGLRDRIFCRHPRVPATGRPRRCITNTGVTGPGRRCAPPVGATGRRHRPAACPTRPRAAGGGRRAGAAGIADGSGGHPRRTANACT